MRRLEHELWTLREELLRLRLAQGDIDREQYERLSAEIVNARSKEPPEAQGLEKPVCSILPTLWPLLIAGMMVILPPLATGRSTVFEYWRETRPTPTLHDRFLIQMSVVWYGMAFCLAVLAGMHWTRRAIARAVWPVATVGMKVRYSLPNAGATMRWSGCFGGLLAAECAVLLTHRVLELHIAWTIALAILAFGLGGTASAWLGDWYWWRFVAPRGFWETILEVRPD